MNILVIGAGPVGLVTACGYASLGHRVSIFEISQPRRAALERGLVDFYEPGLSEVYARHHKNGEVSIYSSLQAALETLPEMIFVCVGTPSIEDSGQTDLSYLKAFFKDFFTIANGLKADEGQGHSKVLIVIKSTVPVGTTESFAKELEKHSLADRFCLAFSPEFLRQGSALQDFNNPDRIVFGATSICNDLCFVKFKNLTGGKDNFIFVKTSSESAELAKYAANAFLPLKITFANQISNFARAFGISGTEALKIVGLDARIGESFLSPGPGFGGSCFPKDLASLVVQGEQKGVDMSLARETLAANLAQQQLFVKRILERCTNRKEAVIGVFGLAFKPNTSDLRASPGLAIAKSLAKEVRTVLAFDPLVDKLDQEEIVLCTSPSEVLSRSNVLVITTDDPIWLEFVNPLDWPNLIIIDCRTIFLPQPGIIHLI